MPLPLHINKYILPIFKVVVPPVVWLLSELDLNGRQVPDRFPRGVERKLPRRLTKIKTAWQEGLCIEKDKEILETQVAKPILKSLDCYNTLNRLVWRVQITVPGAEQLRLYFSQFNVGEGQVLLHASNGDRLGPYTRQGLNKNREFWSDFISGNSVVIEYWPNMNKSPQHQVRFQLKRLFHVL